MIWSQSVTKNKKNEKNDFYQNLGIIYIIIIQK